VEKAYLTDFIINIMILRKYPLNMVSCCEIAEYITKDGSLRYFMIDKLEKVRKNE
jgi:hypothetical protein